jgi:hypothetical protein
MRTLTELNHPTKEFLYNLYGENSNYLWLRIEGFEKVLYKRIITVGHITNHNDLAKLQVLTRKKIALDEVCLWELSKQEQVFFGRIGLTLVIIPKGARIQFGLGKYSKKMPSINIYTEHPSAIAIGDELDFSVKNLNNGVIQYLVING